MRLLAIVFLLLSLSCSEKTDKYKLGYFSDGQISLDTLVIDSGDEIIFTGRDIIGFDISVDKKHLYNFNPFDHTLEQINLDELRLEKKIQFEKEGPNGTGDFVSFISIHDENHLVIKGMTKSEIFNMKGEKMRTIDYENYSLGWKNGEEVRIPSPLLDPNFDRLYVLIKKELDKSYALGILDFETYEVNSIPLDSFQGFIDYTFNLRVLKATIRTPSGVYLRMFDRKLVLSSQVDNELLIYDIEEDKLYPKSNRSRLNADRKVNDYQYEHESEESKNAEYKRFHLEINYLPPFWDEKNQIFYRFSYEELPSESEVADYVKSKIYLTALDKDFNLIGEMLIPELTILPLNGTFRQFPQHFAKDGKIWIYENINDEMGFVELRITK
jgi:hypothetical protein